MELTFTFLAEEPRKATKLEQCAFTVTRPIAGLIHKLDKRYRQKLKERRSELADMNKRDFIECVSSILFEEVLAFGAVDFRNRTICQLLCLGEARNIFEERKRNGYFDDLNIMK